MIKKIILVLLALAVLLGAYFYLGKSGLVPDKTSNLAVSTYSLDGLVVSISANNVVATVGRVEERSGGNTFVTEEKSMKLAPTLWFVNGKKSIEISSSKLSSYLKQRDHVVFYGWSNGPLSTSGTLTVTKIEFVASGTVTSLPRSAPVVR